MASKPLQFELPCPYQWTCSQTKKIKNLCLEKMKVMVFKLDESEKTYDWLPLINFCRQQPEWRHVMNSLRAAFGPDIFFELKETMLID